MKSQAIQHISSVLADVKPAEWPAYLKASFTGAQRNTRLQRLRHAGPLYVQKAFYPEGRECAHLYVLHPPGGIVSGDTLTLQFELEDESHVLVTTPGATRLYRARIDHAAAEPLPQQVYNRLSLSNGSVIEWLPAETIVYDGAHIELSTDIELDAQSQFLGWEIVCLGLPASRQPFESGAYTQRIRITVDGVVKLVDRLQFSADSDYLSARCGFQRKPICGTMIAGCYQAAKASEVASALREQLSAEPHGFAVTDVQGFIVLRYLGDCSAECRALFIAAWKILRPLLISRLAVEPRIWAT